MSANSTDSSSRPPTAGAKLAIERAAVQMIASVFIAFQHTDLDAMLWPDRQSVRCPARGQVFVQSDQPEPLPRLERQMHVPHSKGKLPKQPPRGSLEQSRAGDDRKSTDHQSRQPRRRKQHPRGLLLKALDPPHLGQTLG